MTNSKCTYEVKVLGADSYEGKENGWYGDCVIIYDVANKKMVVYDCGSEQHAEKVIDFMDEKKIDKTDIILSHNDGDHFKGIPTLIDNDKVGKIFTTLLLKYVDEILDKLDDDRRKRETTKERILDVYNNIAELDGHDLRDIYIDGDELPDGIVFIGPDKGIMIEAAANAIRENDIHSKEGSETLANATSLQIAVSLNNGKSLLLVADAAVENIVCDLTDYVNIQLPHHGKLASAEAVFEKIADNIGSHVFIVSDNTGETNGGSDDLMDSDVSKGKIIRNTKIIGNISVGVPVYATIDDARKDYGICSGT